MIRFWRLSEISEDNLGLACGEGGLTLARTQLIEQHGNWYAVRDRAEIQRLLSRAYGYELSVDRLMPGLTLVASALNAGDRCLAHIAAVHLRLPDVPNETAREDMEIADSLIKCLRKADMLSLDSPGPASEVRKASPDDPKHPGWPAGTDGGLGGKFRPKEGSEVATVQQLRESVARRALRIAAIAVLSLAAEAAVESVPGVDVAATAAMLASMAKLISEFKQLKIDADAAIEFVNNGPYDLKDLQPSSGNEYQEFSSYAEFYKRSLPTSYIAKWAGPAGDGSEYHHIVTQGGNNADNFSPEQLQNTDNIIILPTLLHEAVNAEYSKIKQGTNMTVYQWLQTQPYDVQYQDGLTILRDLHIIK